MNRKDTILMAVIVNAGLLLTLFLSAIRSDPAKDAPVPLPMAASEPRVAKVVKVGSGDAIDGGPGVCCELKEGRIRPTQAKIDFAKELEAITKAAEQKRKGKLPPVADSGGVEVTVVSGDSLARIASLHGTTVAAMMRANGLRTTVLQIGQKLKVPAKGGARKDALPGSYYVVKQGDNPWTIAVKNQIKVDELLRLNNLNGEKARHLKPGDRLKIR